MPELNKKTFRNIFFIAVACIVLYWLLHETDRVKRIALFIGDMFSPFVAGAAVAFILNVPMRAFENLLKGVKHNGLRRVISIILTFIAVVLVITLVFLLLIPQVVETIQSLIPRLYDFILELEVIIQNFLNDNPELMRWISENTDFTSLDWASLAQRDRKSVV